MSDELRKMVKASERSFRQTTHPCNENRGKIDDFIAILEPINCALYRDRSRFRQKSVFNHDLIGDFFLENRDKIVQTDDFLRMRIQSPKVTEF
jgi:hypothetical protein